MSDCALPTRQLCPDGGSIEVDGGGLQIVVDLRFRF